MRWVCCVILLQKFKGKLCLRWSSGGGGSAEESPASSATCTCVLREELALGRTSLRGMCGGSCLSVSVVFLSERAALSTWKSASG